MEEKDAPAAKEAMQALRDEVEERIPSAVVSGITASDLWTELCDKNPLARRGGMPVLMKRWKTEPSSPSHITHSAT